MSLDSEESGGWGPKKEPKRDPFPEVTLSYKSLLIAYRDCARELEDKDPSLVASINKECTPIFEYIASKNGTLDKKYILAEDEREIVKRYVVFGQPIVERDYKEARYIHWEDGSIKITVITQRTPDRNNPKSSEFVEFEIGENSHSWGVLNHPKPEKKRTDGELSWAPYSKEGYAEWLLKDRPLSSIYDGWLKELGSKYLGEKEFDILITNYQKAKNKIEDEVNLVYKKHSPIIKNRIIQLTESAYRTRKIRPELIGVTDIRDEQRTIVAKLFYDTYKKHLFRLPFKDEVIDQNETKSKDADVNKKTISGDPLIDILLYGKKTKVSIFDFFKNSKKEIDQFDFKNTIEADDKDWILLAEESKKILRPLNDRFGWEYPER